MPYGDGPRDVINVLATCGDDDVAICNQAMRAINEIKSRAADEIELWTHVKGYSIAAMYERGGKVEAIAQALGVSKASVIDIAKRYGATPRYKASIAVPFEQTPGVDALEQIREARKCILAELSRLHRNAEAEQVRRTERTLERWSRPRRGIGKVAGSGALLVGGAVLGNLGTTAAVSTVTTTSGVSVAQMIGVGALGAALVVGPPVVSTVMRPPDPPATSAITAPSWDAEHRNTPVATPETSPEGPPAESPSPSVSASPSPKVTIRPITGGAPSPTVTKTSAHRRPASNQAPVVIIPPPSPTPAVPALPSSWTQTPQASQPVPGDQRPAPDTDSSLPPTSLPAGPDAGSPAPVSIIR